MYRTTLLTLSESCQMWGSGVTLRWIVGSKIFIRRVVSAMDRQTDIQPVYQWL